MEPPDRSPAFPIGRSGSAGVSPESTDCGLRTSEDSRRSNPVGETPTGVREARALPGREPRVDSLVHRLRVGIASLILSLAVAGAAAARPPNLVFIYADDLGWSDTGYGGSDFYETPHLDRLRAQGMLFTDAYAPAGNCAPSRASLLSGLYSPRHGLYAVNSTNRGPQEAMRLEPVPNRIDLAPGFTTFAERLRAAGYATGLFGKWHVDDRLDPATLPPAQGFEVYFDSRLPSPNPFRDEPDDPKGAFSLTRAACDFMTWHRERPFFAFVSHHAVHSDLEATPASLRKFEAKKPGRLHNEPLYAACVHDLDAAVGMLLAKLAELGLEENTLVVFTSDNGGGDGRSQEPLRGGKGGYYEGGIRAPMLVRWPGVVAAGGASDVPVTQIDLFPTWLAAAGVRGQVPALDGRSLLPLLRGEEAWPARPIFWHFPGYLDRPVNRGRDEIFRTRPVSVVRLGEWKLHLFWEEWLLDGGREGLPGNLAVELYHLGDDPGEHRDLAADRPRERDELLEVLLAWLRDTSAPVPALRKRS